MRVQSKAAYLAGFMDGEGTFSVVKTYEIKRRKDGTKNKIVRHHLHVRITNTNKKVLDWVSKNFGGQVYGKRSEKTWKPRWDYASTSNKKTEKLVLAILPYLIVKKEQALVALDFIKLHGQAAGQERDVLRRKMLMLNNSSQPHSNSPTTNTPNSSESELKIESDLMGDHESAPVVTQTA